MDSQGWKIIQWSLRPPRPAAQPSPFGAECLSLAPSSDHISLLAYFQQQEVHHARGSPCQGWPVLAVKKPFLT